MSEIEKNTAENPVTNTSAEKPAVQVIRQSAPHEIDLLDLFRIYIKKWLPLGIVSIIAAILVFVGIKVVINSNAINWNITMEFEYPGKSSGLYPDGTTFKYTDFISSDIITEALASVENTEGLTAEDISKSKIITIEANSSTVNGVKTYDGTYTFTVKSRYFDSQENAYNLLNATAEAISNKITTSATDVYYRIYLDSFDYADTFSDKLSALQKQKEYIAAKYQEWIDAYGDQYMVGGYTLSRYMENANQAMSDKEYSSLSYELQKRQYVYKQSDDEKLVCNLQIEILQDELEDNAKKIETLTAALENLRAGQVVASYSDLSGQTNEKYYYDTIATLTERQVDIEREITNLNLQIENMSLTEETNEYNEKLNTVRDNLEAQAEILEKTISPAIYTEKTEYEFDVLGFTTVGGKSASLYAIVAFVAVYIIVGFFMFIFEDDDRRKAAKA